MITKYGYQTITLIVFVLFIIVDIAIIQNNIYLRWLLIGLSTIFLIFTLNFFRDPERKTPVSEEIIVSPADGRVLLIKDVFEDKYINEDCVQVSVFMSPLNVHVNRIPISGTVEFNEYVTGKFLKAFDDKADKENERTEIGINSVHGKILFTQVAGFVARRIINDLKMSQPVNIGKRFGMIKFGSRVDVIVPKKWIVKVKPGDIVRAGESILFGLK
ncbi:MAG: phosphatidylserine decarboxylase family protein [Ignavibacteriales bacterium]|nr:phosphatidylserine decarboxylase family protein [Ignavibacteriales bacterium]MCF8306910.1 phosphatidylserine decarboxylase family protein [Ignavibacteriales bacterium]MCF8438144.1 phosphatidylserine decarboxylase family protein [Ignavibacteriales bacterium]